MSSSAFAQFMGLMEKQSFDSYRKEVLDHALLTSWFTTDQMCIRDRFGTVLVPYMAAFSFDDVDVKERVYVE